MKKVATNQLKEILKVVKKIQGVKWCNVNLKEDKKEILNLLILREITKKED